MAVLGLSFVGCAVAIESDLIGPEAAAKWVAETPDIQVLDVRTPAEYAEGHLKDAIRVTWGEDDFEKQAKAALDLKRPVLVYCRSGRRSTAATESLQKLGFKNLKNLEGGIVAWQKAGKTVIKP